MIECLNTTTITISNISTPSTLLPQNHTASDGSVDPNSADASGGEGTIVKFVIMDILVPLVCALGLVGNLLSLVVLATEKMHRTLTKMEISAHIGLIALAVSDFLFCLLVLIFTQVTMKDYYEPDDALVYFDFLSNGLITIFIIFSTWLIVVMAAERYIAVCHPLRARKLISLRRTRTVIGIVFTVCIIATIPIFLEKTIEEVECYDGRVMLILKKKQSYLRRIIWAVFFDFVPCIALIYFNMCLIIQVRRAKKLRDGLAPTHYTFQANKAASKGHQNKCRHTSNMGDHASNSLLKYNNVQQKTNSTRDIATGHKTRIRGAAGRGVKIVTSHNACNGSTVVETAPNSQDRYTRLTTHQHRNYDHSRSTQDSTSTASLTPSRQNMVGRRMITPTYASSSVVKKRPSDGALNSVTATLVAVVLLFLVLVSPSELLKFSLTYTGSDQGKIVMYVTNFMQVLNFSLNFVLYCAVNKTFRHTLRGLACCCWLSITG